MPSSTWKESVVDVSNTPEGFMNTNEWRDKGDSDEGCLMSLVRPLAVTALLVLALVVAYVYAAPAVIELWWS